jgi:hypothetical protein
MYLLFHEIAAHAKIAHYAQRTSSLGAPIVAPGENYATVFNRLKDRIGKEVRTTTERVG